MILLACQCGRELQTGDDLAGKQVRCPFCGSVQAVPAPSVLGTNSIADGAVYTHGNPPASGNSRSAGGTLQPQQQFGKYLIQQWLGAGAMGEVWLAHDTALDRDVAIKVLPPSLGRDEEQLRRFFREARSAAQLNHPNAVTIYEVDVTFGLPFLAMELVTGGSLQERVAQHGPLDWREATLVVRDAAAGLAEAHARGFVHRDIKPANLLWAANGLTKVADFGLARAGGRDTLLTAEGAQVGTPAFMAPEQWRGHEVDARTDLYSLACTYYFLLTGRVPYAAPSAAALAYQHLHEQFPDARAFAPGLPERLRQCLLRGAQKDPNHRFQSAAELVAELDALLANPSSLSSSGLANAAAPIIVAASHSRLSHASAVRRRPQRPFGLQAVCIAGALLLGIGLYVAFQDGLNKRVVAIGNPEVIEKQPPKPSVPAPTPVARPAPEPPINEPEPSPPSPAAPVEATAPPVAPPPALDVPVDLRKPVPAADELAATERRFSAKHGEAIGGVKTPAERLALAGQFMRQGGDAQGDPTERYVLLREAKDLAASAGDATLAFQCAERLIDSYACDAWDLRTATLDALRKAPGTSVAQKKALVEQGRSLADRAIDDDRFDAAKEIATTAVSVARQCKEPAFIKQSVAHQQEISALADEHTAAVAARSKLKEIEHDPAANLALGRFLCFIKGDWDMGLPVLARGDDASLAALAAADLAKPTDADKQKRLADGWWDWSRNYEGRKRKQVQRHAGLWCQQCVSFLVGAERATIQRRLADLRKPNSESLAAGLRWLAQHQRGDGSWTFAVGPNPGKLDAPVAATAMALLPFVRGPESGEHKDLIQKGVAYLLAQQKRHGGLREEGATMYGHALATLALCEAYERTHDADVRARAQLAVNFIVVAQDPKGGGWRYAPREAGDTSVTVWQLTALRTASKAKLQIPAATLAGARTFLDFVQADSGASYGYLSPKDHTTLLSTMGLLARIYSGAEPRHPVIAKGIKNTLTLGCNAQDSYFNYYATSLAREAGGDDRTIWDAAMKTHLINHQQAYGDAAGSWASGDKFLQEQGGRLAVTSISLLTLLCLDE